MCLATIDAAFNKTFTFGYCVHFAAGWYRKPSSIERLTANQENKWQIASSMLVSHSLGKHFAMYRERLVLSGFLRIKMCIIHGRTACMRCMRKMEKTKR
jgi:hypothetical protein